MKDPALRTTLRRLPQRLCRARKASLPLVLMLAFALSACSTPRSPDSPELRYSANAESARQLQVPPDLTDVSDGEQFILPGTADGKITRNSLLPVVEQARLMREGGERWLQIDAPPEEVWPRLLAFLRDQKFPIEQTEPVAGTITTQWRPASAVRSGGLIRNLISKDDSVERVAFRLERSGQNGTRLFSRFQSATQAQAGAAEPWPAEAGNSEETSALLARLLAFLGVDEQRRQGLLSAADARNVMSGAVLQSSTAGSQIVLYKGYLPSFNGVSAALGELGYTIDSADDGVGRIETHRGKVGADQIGKDAADKGKTNRLVFSVSPVHVSSARVSLTNEQGRSLPPDDEREVLEALRDVLA